jgi:outer membrane protein TolC
VLPPGETKPIDLPTALRLADAQNPEVALARERIREALARQELAEVLWLPNLELGTTWTRHDGQIQRSVGDVFTTSRSSLFVGGGPALNLALSEAIFAPLAARQLTAARRAGAAGVANEQLLDVAVAYIDLLQAYAELQINLETKTNARQLLKLTEDYEKAGKGAAADTARARTEVNRRERQGIEIQARIGLTSARLVQLLQLPPEFLLQPAEPAVVPIAIVPEQMPLEELLTQAVANRPELAENRALLSATVEAWRAAKVAPWVPSLRLSYAAGGFGGGINDFFGDFGGRGDASMTAVWQLQNFGLGNRALIQERRSQYAQSTFRQASIEARVASQVVSSFRVAFARRQELDASQREVAAARESYRLNEERIRRAPEQGRPIELLQAIQALAQARLDYLVVVADYNRAQFRLYTAVGNPPLCALGQAAAIATTEPTTPPNPNPTPPEQGPPPARLLPPRTQR